MPLKSRPRALSQKEVVVARRAHAASARCSNPENLSNFEFQICISAPAPAWFLPAEGRMWSKKQSTAGEQHRPAARLGSSSCTAGVGVWGGWRGANASALSQSGTAEYGSRSVFLLREDPTPRALAAFILPRGTGALLSTGAGRGLGAALGQPGSTTAFEVKKSPEIPPPKKEHCPCPCPCSRQRDRAAEVGWRREKA